MVSHDFHRPPQTLFAFRMIFPAIAVLLLSYVVMGFVALAPAVQELNQKTAAIMPLTSVSEDPLQAIGQQASQTVRFFSHVPTLCREGNAISDFQKQRCQNLWNRLYVGLGLILAPFAIAAFFFLIVTEQFKGFYQQCRSLVEKGKALQIGTVTQPASAPSDFFSWAYCLRPIRVELSDRKQLTAYLPLAGAVPPPGQKLALFDVGTQFGAKRQVGVPYFPHVVIFKSNA